MPSICPFLSACTAWSLVSNGAACSEVLDLVGDRGVAGGADLGAELGVLQVGDRGGAVDRAARGGDDGLADVVVAAGEVDRLAALLGDRDLVDVEVELLLPRADHRVERHDRPSRPRPRRSRAPRRSRRRRRTRSPCRWSGRRRRTTARTPGCRSRRSGHPPSRCRERPSRSHAAAAVEPLSDAVSSASSRGAQAVVISRATPSVARAVPRMVVRMREG